MAYQYPDLLGPIERGQRMKLDRDRAQMERDRARMEAEKFLLDQAEARRLADYNERMLRVNEGREARMVADAALALERERRFNELYQQNLSRFTGTPEKSTETWGYVGPRREPTWREQQDAYTRAAMGSGNLNMVSDIFSARAREELEQQQAQNRQALEALKAENILTRQATGTGTRGLGYFNIYDLSGNQVGRVHFQNEEERNNWLRRNGHNLTLEPEEGSGDTIYTIQGNRAVPIGGPTPGGPTPAQVTQRPLPINEVTIAGETIKRPRPQPEVSNRAIYNQDFLRILRTRLFGEDGKLLPEWRDPKNFSELERLKNKLDQVYEELSGYYE